MKKHKIIIDTDIGNDIDDALSIAFALKRPELDIKAITTVYGDTDKRAALVKKLLHVTGREDIPVGAGCCYPMKGFNQRERDFSDNLAKYSSINHLSAAVPFDTEDTVYHDGVQLILDTIESHMGELFIVALGPLTNIASAIIRRPKIVKKIKKIFIMGGEIDLYRREYNIASDTQAADIVLTSGIPMFIGTWNVTRRFTIPVVEYGFFKDGRTLLHKTLYDMIMLWDAIKGDKPGPVMYDIAPIIAVFNDTLYKTKQMKLSVETAGIHTMGVTVAQAGTEHDVTVDIDAEGVKKLFYETIGY